MCRFVVAVLSLVPCVSVAPSGDGLTRDFEVLADDHATPEEWLRSAENITLRSDIQRPNGIIAAQQPNCTPDKPAPKPFGEALRTHQNPSVTELLVKRTAWLALSGKPETCRMAVMAYRWDPQGSISALHLAGNLEVCRSDSFVALARMSAGDSHAAAEWAEAIRKEARGPRFISKLFPLWIFPGDAVMQQTADWLFNRPNAPLAPSADFTAVASPLLAIREYRQAVLAALNDSSVVGKATRSRWGMLSIALKDGGRVESLEVGTDPRQVPPGQERPVRVKDMVALRLIPLGGLPPFEPDWPEPDKDRVIRDIAAFLQLHGSELKAFPSKLEDTACLDQGLYLSR